MRRAGLPIFLLLAVFFYSTVGFCEEPPKIHVEAFNVTGNTVISTDDILSVVSEAKERDYTLKELDTIAQSVTALYHKKGYILARAYIPSQRVENGILTIAVLEGKLDSIEVEKPKYYRPSYIEGFFKHLRGRPVREAELEEAALMANKTPSLKTKALLTKGEAPGTSNLAVDVEDSYPINLVFTFDNHGHPLVSRNKYALHFDITDPYIGSTLSAEGAFGEDMDETTSISIDYKVPVNRRGTSVGVKYSYSDYIVGGNLQPLGIEGDAEITGIYVAHDFMKSRRKNLSAMAGFDYKRIFSFVLNTQQSNDDLSVAYIGASFDAADRLRGRTYSCLTYFHGFNNLFGSLGENDPARSRFGASGRFDKFRVDLMRVQAVTDHSALYLKSSGQQSLDRLVGSEKFSIGGADTVRGHSVAKFSGDSGYTLSAEFNAPLPLTDRLPAGKGKKVSDVFKAAVFIDHGGVYAKNPAFGESRSEYLTSAGVGARLALFDRLYLTLDVGYPIENGDLKTEHEIVYVMGKFNALNF